MEVQEFDRRIRLVYTNSEYYAVHVFKLNRLHHNRESVCNGRLLR